MDLIKLIEELLEMQKEALKALWFELDESK